ncbi:MAG: hypothetical protein LLG06_14945 [Desulfobacteraceae bacterium]|nr:hypothetical protein [Desulfobacteraceae bacterium]
MRIDGILRQQSIQGTEESKKKGSTGTDTDFTSLLNEELSDVSSESSTGSVSETEMIGNTFGITLSPADSEMVQSVSALEDTLAKLESLEQALQENTSPKEIDSLVSQIGTEASGLDEKLSGLPGDHPLKEVAEELKILSYVESVKWKRGDYL